MYKLDEDLKMVKTKRDIKSPRRRLSGGVSRPVSRAKPAPAPIGGANVKVVVRVRPTNHREDGDNYR